MKRMERTGVGSLQQQAYELVGILVAPALAGKQAEGLAVFVACALTLGRAILTDLAVIMRQQGFAAAAKHALKRLSRWVNNPRIQVGTAMGPVIQRLVKKRKKKLVVSLDWVDLRGFKTLVAAANIKGRAVWLLWKSVPAAGLNLNMSRIEQELLFELKQLLPRTFKVIVLADRGFFKSRLFKYCQMLHLDYVIRIKPDYTVAAAGYQGSLLDLPVKPGLRRFWRNARCGKRPVVVQNLVIYYQKHLPEKRDEPWFLATSLQGTPTQIVTLYAKRMGIEECFRDKKNVNNGWGLRQMRLTNAANLDRFLLILTIAYLILCGLGLYALRHWHPRLWCGNNRPGECGVFTIARRVLDLIQIPLAQALAEIGLSSKSLAPRWG